MRGLKQNNGFTNSLVQLPRVYFERSPSNSTLKLTKRGNQIFPSYDAQIQPNQSHENGINQSSNLTSRVQILEYKLNILQRQQNRQQNKPSPFQQLNKSNSASQLHAKNELNCLKQDLFYDLSHQKQEIRNQNLRVEQMSIRQVKMQQQMRQMLNQQKMQTNFKISNHNQQLKGCQMFKQKQFDYQYENLKTHIQNVQQKIYHDIENKLKLEIHARQHLMKQIKQIKQQLQGQIKSDKENNNRFMKDLKDSLSLIRQIIGKDQKYMQEAVEDINKQCNSQISKLNKKISQCCSDLNNKQHRLLQRIQDLKGEFKGYKMSNTQQIQQYKSIVLTVQDAQLQNAQSRYLQSTTSKIYNIETIKQELQQWKTITQQKNVNIYRQITNAMKQIKIQSKKQIDSILRDHQQLKKMNTDHRNLLNKRMDKQRKQITDVIAQQFDILLDQIQKINDLVSLGKQENDKHIAQAIDKQQFIIAKMHQEDKLKVSQKMQQNQRKMQMIQKNINKNLCKQINGLKDQIQEKERVHKETYRKYQLQLQKDRQNRVLKEDQLKKQIVLLINKSKDASAKEICQAMQSLQKNIKQTAENIKNEQSQLKKKTQNSISTALKNQQNGFQKIKSQSAQTNKLVAKVKQELTNLINETASKNKKEKQSGQSNLKQSLQSLKKQNETQITNLKQKIQQKIKESKNECVEASKKHSDSEINSLKLKLQEKIKETKNQLNAGINKKQQQSKKKEQQNKAKSQQFDKKIMEMSTKLKNEISYDMKASQIAKNNEVKSLIEQSAKTCMKSIEQESVKGKKNVQQKIKQAKAEIMASIGKKQEESRKKQQQSKAKNQELDKKMAELSTKIKSQINSEIKANESLKNAQIDKKINQSSSKIKLQIQNDIKNRQKQQKQKQVQLKTQFDKKIDTSLSNLKKQMQNNVTKELLKNSQELKKISQREKASENDAKIKGAQINKKVEEQLGNIKKQISQQFSKNKKILSDQLNKLNAQILKTKTQIDGRFKNQNVFVDKNYTELALKIQKNKNESQMKFSQMKGVSMNNLKEKEKEAENSLSTKLSGLRNQMVQMIEEKYKKNDATMAEVSSLTKQSAMKQENASKFLTKSMQTHSKQVKEMINKMQAYLFSEKNKNNSIISKMQIDLRDMSDMIANMALQLKPSK